MIRSNSQSGFGRARHGWLLTSCAAAATLAFASGAAAQDAQQQTPDAELDEVIVTGSYRASVEAAIDIKRENVGFSDAIVATDVAEFPEQNLSEALQRVPGVTIERNKGLGTRVNVRGLPSEFTFVSINDLATASGSGGRDVEFDIFASEIIQQVVVQKSPTAASEEGGIAGNIEIRTARPFDYAGSRVVASVEGAHNSISEEVDPEYSFLASNTWGDWGALVSFAQGRRTNRTDSNSGINFRPAFRFLEAGGTREAQARAVLLRDVGLSLSDADMDNRNVTGRIIFQDKVGDRVYINEQDKWGATLALQYRPSSTFSLSFDALVGGYDQTEDEYDAAAYSASSRSTFETIHAYDDETLSDYGLVVLRDVSYTATQHEFLSKERINETEYQQFGAEMTWRGDNWVLNALAGYSGAEKTLDNSNLKHVAYKPSRTRWTEDGGETVPSASSAGFDMYNSPASYLFEAYETNLEHITDDKYAAQADYTRYFDVPVLESISIGGRWTDKSKERQYGSRNIQGPAAGSTAWLNTRTLADSPIQPIGEIVPGGDYTVRDIDWSMISNEFARDFFRYDGFETPFSPGDYYEVSEEVLAAYVMADLGFDLGAVPVSVNGGLRYVDTSIESSGYHQVQTPTGGTTYTPEPVSSEGSYDKVLPSLNFTAELTDSLVFRGAASETLMRPALTDLAYKRTASWNSFRFTDGNPNLKPTYAKQWELGLEKYIGDGDGLLAVSYFWKEIEGVVRQALTGEVPNVTKYNANGTVDGVYTFDVYQPVNAEGSYEVSGVELVAVVPFGMIWQRLDGFGVNANYTLLDSSLTGQSILDIPTAPIGLAETTWNATLYYENPLWEARVSYNFKDDYVEGIGYEMYPIWRSAYGQFDAAFSYNLRDNLQIDVRAINLTDEETKGYTMDPSFPTTYELSGRRISLGLRMNF